MLRPSSLAARLARLLRAKPPAVAIEPEVGARRRSGSPAQGTPSGKSKTRTIVVRVDDETFDRLSRTATAADTTVTEAIRQVIKRGLDRA